NVPQTATSIKITPDVAGVQDGNTRQFSAKEYDQFGVALTTQPTFTWSLPSGSGSINSSTGLYTAPALGSGNLTAAIKATAASIMATAPVTTTDSSSATPSLQIQSIPNATNLTQNTPVSIIVDSASDNVNSWVLSLLSTAPGATEQTIASG